MRDVSLLEGTVFLVAPTSETFWGRKNFEDHLLRTPASQWPNIIVAIESADTPPIRIAVSLSHNPHDGHKFSYKEV